LDISPPAQPVIPASGADSSNPALPAQEQTKESNWQSQTSSIMNAAGDKNKYGLLILMLQLVVEVDEPHGQSRDMTGHESPFRDSYKS